MLSHFLLITTQLLLLRGASSRLLDFEAIGGKAELASYAVGLANAKLLNITLQETILSGDQLYFSNKTFFMLGGIYADMNRTSNITITIDGTILFSNDRSTWPKKKNGDVMECIEIYNLKDSILTSNGKGTLDGNGIEWWGAIKFVEHGENRPRLMHLHNS